MKYQFLSAFIISYFAMPMHMYATQMMRQATTPLELEMIKEACNGTLTEKSFEKYLKDGININAKEDSQGWTVLIAAISNKNANLAKLLIENGADVNAKDKGGSTALMFANDNLKLIKLLIEHGADVNAKDNNGKTPLTFAAMANSTDSVKLLIAHGADQDLKNRNHKKAVNYAEDKTSFQNAVTAGLADRKKAQEEVAKQPNLYPDIANIVSDYAYGPAPKSLPEQGRCNIM